MIAQVILTLALSAAWIYVVTQSGTSRFIKFPLYLAVGAGLYFVWYPNMATRLANSIGIGRGADLLLHTWIIFSLGVLINLHVKIRQHLSLITQLSRHIAIENPCMKSQVAEDTTKKPDLDQVPDR